MPPTLAAHLTCTARGRSPTAEARSSNDRKCGFESHRPYEHPFDTLAAVTKSAETVALALALFDAGWSKAAIARELAVSRASIRDWATSDRSELLRHRDQRAEHSPSGCERIDGCNTPSYAYLLGQYLGDGCISEGAKGVYALRIACCDQYPEIRLRVERSMAAVLPNRVSKAQSEGCTYVVAYSKHWPCVFPQHGRGRKHERAIEFAPWQEAIVATHTRDFTAGLFHSDGCRCINRVNRSRNRRTKTYEYPRYFFSNMSMDILHICGDALDLLGVEWRFNNRNSISVARKASVALLDQFIGPKT